MTDLNTRDHKNPHHWRVMYAKRCTLGGKSENGRPSMYLVEEVESDEKGEAVYRLEDRRHSVLIRGGFFEVNNFLDSLKMTPPRGSCAA